MSVYGWVVFGSGSAGAVAFAWRRDITNWLRHLFPRRQQLAPYRHPGGDR